MWFCRWIFIKGHLVAIYVVPTIQCLINDMTSPLMNFRLKV